MIVISLTTDLGNSRTKLLNNSNSIKFYIHILAILMFLLSAEHVYAKYSPCTEENSHYLFQKIIFLFPYNYKNILHIHCEGFKHISKYFPGKYVAIKKGINNLSGKNHAIDFIKTYPESLPILALQKNPDGFVKNIMVYRKIGETDKQHAKRQRLILSVLALENSPVYLAQLANAFGKNRRSLEAIERLAITGLAPYAFAFTYERKHNKADQIYDLWLSNSILNNDNFEFELSIAKFHGEEIRRHLALNVEFRENLPGLIHQVKNAILSNSPNQSMTLFDSFLETRNVWRLLERQDAIDILRRWPAIVATAFYGDDTTSGYMDNVHDMIANILIHSDDAYGIMVVSLVKEKEFKNIVEKRGMDENILHCVIQRSLRRHNKDTPLKEAVDKQLLSKWADFDNAWQIEHACNEAPEFYDSIPVIGKLPRIIDRTLDGRIDTYTAIYQTATIAGEVVFYVCTVACTGGAGIAAVAGRGMMVLKVANTPTKVYKAVKLVKNGSKFKKINAENIRQQLSFYKKMGNVVNLESRVLGRISHTLFRHYKKESASLNNASSLNISEAVRSWKNILANYAPSKTSASFHWYDRGITIISKLIGGPKKAARFIEKTSDEYNTKKILEKNHNNVFKDYNVKNNNDSKLDLWRKNVGYWWSIGTKNKLINDI